MYLNVNLDLPHLFYHESFKSNISAFLISFSIFISHLLIFLSFPPNKVTNPNVYRAGKSHKTAKWWQVVRSPGRGHKTAAWKSGPYTWLVCWFLNLKIWIKIQNSRLFWKSRSSWNIGVTLLSNSWLDVSITTPLDGAQSPSTWPVITTCLLCILCLPTFWKLLSFQLSHKRIN